MSEQPSPQPPSDVPRQMPEGMLESRLYGEIPADALPWIDSGGVAVSEATFQDGNILIASAIPAKLQKSTREINESADRRTSEGEEYNELDNFFYQAAHLEANGEATSHPQIRLLKGTLASDFDAFTIKYYREGHRPNGRRLYYLLTSTDRLPISRRQGTEPTEAQNVLIRLGLTDKKHQTKTLTFLTKGSHGQVRSSGGGSQ